MNKALLPTAIIVLVLLADQILKIWIKLNMYIGQEFLVFGQWFRIHFTENEGMAFGMTLGGEYGKITLTLFRIIAVTFIGVYLYTLLNKRTPRGLIVSISLILAGALGNIIDSVFYGVVFTDSYSKLATFLPEGGGYASWFHGKVVDMLYFPVFEGFLPDWFPIWGGEHMIFFRPVFNIADAAITVGVFMIIIFQRSYFKEEDKEDDAYDKMLEEKAKEEKSADAEPSQENPTVQGAA